MSDPFESMSDGGKHLLDAFSITAMLGALFDMLPAAAALVTIVWTTIRIFETETVRAFLARFRKNS